MSIIETRLADLWFEDDRLLKHIEPLRTMLWEAAEAAGATIITEQAIQFFPHGVTVLLGLAESHALVQSWVDDKLLTVDITTCGNARIDDLIEDLIAKLKPIRHRVVKATRGDSLE
jgi:S-adenosylmethionine decarboxylase